MRRHVLVLAAVLASSAARAAEKQPASSTVSPAAPARAAAPVAPASHLSWYSRGNWDRATFNRSVQIDAPGKTALKSKGRFSLEVVMKGERGDVQLRFFDAAGAPLAQVPGKVHGIEKHEATATGKSRAAGGTWAGDQKWSDAGFDGTSPFSAHVLADGSVRFELRSSKFQGLVIDGTLPAVRAR